VPRGSLDSGIQIKLSLEFPATNFTSFFHELIADC